MSARLDTDGPRTTPLGRVAHAGRATVGVSERSRRRIVALITLIYILLIFEGALRKWLLPGLSRPLFFMRDPLVLGVYWVALASGLRLRYRALLWTGLGIGAAALLLALAQSMRAGAGLADQALFAVYGWRNYFLYIPLAFVIGASFRTRDVERIVRMSLLLAVPIAVLVMIQFLSSPDAPINVGIASDLSQQFRGLAIDETHTRPMGTFTADAGQGLFVTSGLAMVLALWIMRPKDRQIPWWQLMAATGALASCLALSGSRGAVLHVGVVVISATVAGVVVRDRRVAARAALLPALLTAAAVVLYPLVFAEGHAAFLSRWQTAFAFESQSFELGIFGRAAYGLVDFARLLIDTPLAGYGLGLGGNASTTLGASIAGHVPLALAETDWARHIVDLGPVLGVVFIAYRLVLVGWLAQVCFGATRRSGDPAPLILLSFVAVELLTGQISGQGTVNGYAWMFTGLCLALSAPPVPAVASAPAVKARRFPNVCA